MREKKKLKLKKFYFHPVTAYIFLCFLTMLISLILSGMGLQSSYKTFDDSKIAIYKTSLALQPHSNIVTVNNLFSYDFISPKKEEEAKPN